MKQETTKIRKELEKIVVPFPLKMDMHSVKEVIGRSSDRDLIVAVLQQLGFNDSKDYYVIRDITRNGADGGYGGFIYYDEINKFVKENMSEIREYVIDYCVINGLSSSEREASVFWTNYYLDKGYEYSDEDMQNRERFLKVMSIICGFYEWSPYFKKGAGKNSESESIYLYYFLTDSLPKNVEFDLEDTFNTFLAWFCLEGICNDFLTGYEPKVDPDEY